MEWFKDKLCAEETCLLRAMQVQQSFLIQNLNEPEICLAKEDRLFQCLQVPACLVYVSMWLTQRVFCNKIR